MNHKKAMLHMEENEKIMYITEHVLGATSKNSSVKMDQIIAKGIELGVVEDYPRGKEGDHPWFPRASVMSGVVDTEFASEREEPHFHRERMRKAEGGTAMFYWVDWNHRHKKVYRDDAALEVRRQLRRQRKIEKERAEFIEHMKDLNERQAAHDRFMQSDECVEINGKRILKSWIRENPVKAYKLYGFVVNEYIV